MCDDRILDKDDEEIEKDSQELEVSIERQNEAIDLLFDVADELNEAHLLIQNKQYSLAEKKLLKLVDLNLEDLDLKVKMIFLLGCCKYEMGNFVGAEQNWKSIDEGNLQYFAYAQGSLADLEHLKRNNTNKAIEYWNNITKEMDIKSYSNAQWNIGCKLYDSGDIDGALKYWSNITEDMNEYARAQNNLGNEAYRKLDMVKAEGHWWNVVSSESTELSSNALLNLGSLKSDQGDFEKAIEYFELITIGQNYFSAQFNIAMLKLDQKKEDEASTYLKKILKDESPEELRIRAQWELGVICLKQEEYKSIPQYWNSITPLLSKYLTDDAKFLLSIFSVEKGKNFIEVEKYWDGIIFENSYQSRIVYSEIMKMIWGLQEKSKYDFLKKYHHKTTNTVEIRNFKHELMYQVSCLSDYRKEVVDIFNSVGEVSKILHLGNSDFKKFCDRFAHYTRYSTALKMLDKKPSALRLSSMAFMNDPKEGKLIDNLLGLSKDELIDKNNHLAFASCFSFNHNSLNQFRLYGKTELQENSGVSLVFDSNFYQMDMEENSSIEPSIARSSLVKITNYSVSDLSSLEDKIENINIDSSCRYQEKKEEKIQEIGKQPLYRCIYVDPESEYLRVARRSKWSFYRSKKEQALGSKKRYKEYLELLDKTDEKINIEFKKLKQLISKLRELLAKDNDDILTKEQKEEKSKVLPLLNDILLPLRYLIKHAAFEEEEECRMIYITDMSDPKIQSNVDNKWLYVEYEEPVNDHIKKVYLGDGAKDYRPFFERTLGDKSKVRDSNNPFRA